jgi:hypothetical protein
MGARLASSIAVLGVLLAPAALPQTPAPAARPQTPAAAAPTPAPALTWTDIRELGVEGRGWTATKDYYDRLPAKAEGTVREPVWNLSRDSAGMCVRFVSDATEIHARWTVKRERLAMPHMPATSVSGLDLYARIDGRWRWVGATHPAEYPTITARVARDFDPGTREYLLYLPLYNGVTSVEVGVPAGSSVRKAPPRAPERSKPILFYGTSITHGASASRAGMVHTAILGRRLDYPVINLGFSGNGKMEPELAALLAELDPAVYVLDCVPNMTAEEITERVEPFVRALRARRPDTPILMVEDRTYASAILVSTLRHQNTTRRAAYRAAYDRLIAAGTPGLRYLAGEALLGSDGEATVDSSHPTDLGFMRQADALETALRPMLASTARTARE